MAINGDATFFAGATLASQQDFISDGYNFYYWTGDFDKVVPAGATPESTGGFGDGAWKVAGDEELRWELGSDEDKLGDALVSVRQPITGAKPRTQHDKNAEIISIRDFYDESDNGDWAPALNLALTTGHPVFLPPGDPYELKSTVYLPVTGCEIYGSGGSMLKTPTATTATGDGVITGLIADGSKNIYLHDFKFDGGCRPVVISKKAVRGIRLRDSTNIRIENVEVSYTGDWALSLERCSDVIIQNYKHISSDGPHGGRDGLHILDCENVIVRGADIDSGDDCVGVTSEKLGSHSIRISGINGSSQMGSIVIYNEEQDSSGNYISMPADNLHYSDIRLKNGGKCRSVIRMVKYASGSTLTDCSISHVSGIASTSHALQLSGVSGLTLSDIDVKATSNAHGVYLSGCSDVSGYVKGTSAEKNYDGIQIYNCTNVNLIAESINAANYGIHLNTVVNSTLTLKASNCGAAGFADSIGGGARIVNCTDVDIPDGVLIGDTDKSYYGMNYASGNTRVNIGSGVLMRGYIDSINLPISYRLRRPKAMASFKEDSSGVISTYRLYGCTVTRNSTGNYMLTLSEPMNSTGFWFSLQAFHNGSERKVILMSAVTQTGFSFGVRDSAGNAIYADHIKFLAYDS